MLLQLYTKLNLELVHQHARKLKPVVYCQKKFVICSPLFEGSAEGQGVRWGRGVDVATEETVGRGGRICHRVAAANPSPSPGLRSCAPSPGLRRGATDDEQGCATAGVESAFFPFPSFFPSPQVPVGWAYTVFNF
jgi:hypothetical protein